MIYETDTDMLAIWNGLAWRYVAATTPTNGTVLQVQSFSLTGQTVVSSTTWTDLTGLSATITPKSSSSKIYVNLSIQAYFTTGSGTGNSGGGVRLLRNGSVVMQSGSSDSSGSYQIYNSSGGNISSVINIQHLDSPATTSVVTYSLQGHSYSSSITTYFNPNPAQNNAKCVITLMEIAG
jgi:hypothetical protein